MHDGRLLAFRGWPVVLQCQHHAQPGHLWISSHTLGLDSARASADLLARRRSMCSLDRDKPSLHILRVGVGTTSGNGGAVEQKAQVDLTFRHCNVLPMLQASRHHVWPPRVTWFKNCCSPARHFKSGANLSSFAQVKSQRCQLQVVNECFVAGY